jgi:hypothetical protein
MSKTNSSDRFVLRASEIGEYVFCRRAWWLHRVQGIESANVLEMQAGMARHKQHGLVVQRSVWLGRAALALITLAVLFTLLAFLWR